MNRAMTTAPMIAILLRLRRRNASRHRLAPVLVSLVAASSARRWILSVLVATLMSVHPHSRVDEAVRQVHQQVDQDVYQRDEHDETDEHGVVATVDRGPDEGADAAEGEHGLGQDRAGQQGAREQADR